MAESRVAPKAGLRAALKAVYSAVPLAVQMVHWWVVLKAAETAEKLAAW